MPNTVASPAESKPHHSPIDARTQFWIDHWEEYLSRYGPSFDAVKDGEVVITDTELGSLLDRLEVLGLYPGDVWAEWVSRDSETWIL